MEIRIPKPREFPTSQVPSGPVSYGQTWNAQWSKLTSSIFTGNMSYMRGGEFDPSLPDEIEEYIKTNQLSPPDAKYMRTYGTGTRDNFLAAQSHVSRAQRSRDVMSRSTPFQLMASDPALAIEFLVPAGGVLATRLTRSLMRGKPLLLRSTPPETMAWSTRSSSMSIMEGLAPQTPMQTAKIAALTGGLSEAAVQAIESGNAATLDEETIADVRDRIITTAAVAGISGAFGYGVQYVADGRPLPSVPKVGPLRAKERAKAVREGYSGFLSSLRKSESKASDESDIGFANPAFQNSLFVKMLPTPLRRQVNNPNLPAQYKLMMLDLGGDAGMPTTFNQAGQVSGHSVFVSAAAWDGVWFKAVDVLDKEYAKVSARGNATFLNVPIGDYVEQVRRRIGLDSFTKGDWYEHIGRLIIDNVDEADMTPQELASVEAVNRAFVEFEKELENLGLLRSKDVMYERAADLGRKESGMIGMAEAIISSSKKWMDEVTFKYSASFEKASTKLDSLLQTEATRGLTKKQLEYKKSLEDQLERASQNLEKMNDLFERMRNAETIHDLIKMRDELSLTPKMREALGNLSEGLRKISSDLEEARAVVDFYENRRATLPDGNYFTRMWNRRRIESDREGLKGILMKWFRENPEKVTISDDGLPRLVKFSTDPESLSQRADDAIDNILGLIDDDSDEIIYGGARTGPLLTRSLDIPNEIVADYLITDAKEVLISYTSRVAPRIEFQKKFGQFTGNGKRRVVSFGKLRDDLREEMLEDGYDEELINEFLRDFSSLYDQIVGRNIRNPDTWDNRIAEWLRTLTSWTYLGSAGVAAIADASAIFADHELNTIAKGFMGVLDDIDLKMSKRELNLAGGALEISKGTMHLRYLESLTNDPISRTLPDKINNVFYGIGNMLGPVTVFFKTFEGALRSHSLLDYSRKLLDGTANDFEKTFLAQYGIDKNMARVFHEMPLEKSNNGLYLPNTEAWTDPVAVKTFRTALNAGVMNRIIMASPADKPILMGGVMSVPEKWAKHFPVDLPVDEFNKGYRRVESGLFTLPFTFYSYAMGAFSKITSNYAAGAIRNKKAHFIAAMLLGGLVVKIRTPSWAWDKMDTEDKIARAFDFSGIAALHSDLLYRGIAMANELGFENTGPIQPKFSGGTDPFGALVSLAGAPADWSLETARAINEFLLGDPTEGAKDIIRILPLIDALSTGRFMKDLMSDGVDALSGNE